MTTTTYSQSSCRQRKRLLLAYPNMRWQKDDSVTLWNLDPTALCLLAAMVKDLVDVKIIDAQFHNLDRDTFKQQVAEYQPDYVGLSLLTSEYEEALYCAADLVKESCPGIPVLAGGVHVTTMPEHVMETCSAIDYCVIGEGEYVLRELLLFLQGLGTLPENGLAFRDYGLVVQQQAMVDDLSKLPWPGYELV